MKRACLSLVSALALFAQGPQNPPPPPNPAQPQPMAAPMQPRSPQPGQPGRPMQPMRQMPMQPMQPMQPAQPMQQPQPPDFRALREYLGLSDSQVRRMELAGEKARRDAGEKEKTLRPQIEEKRLALEDLLDGASPDATAVGRAMLEIRGLERQIRQAQEGARTAALALLTPEQKTRFKAIQDAANLPAATRQAQRMGLVPGAPGPRPQQAQPMPVQPQPPAR